MHPIDIDGKLAYIDPDGEMVLTTSLNSGGFFIEDRAVVFQDKKCGCIDDSGRLVVEPQFDFMRSFNNGYAAFRKNNKWGLVDFNGKIKIKEQYEAIGNYSCGLIGVQKEKHGPIEYLDLEFNVVVRDVEPWAAIIDFSEGVLSAEDRKTGKWGYLNIDGIWQVEPKYAHTYSFSEGYGAFRFEEKKKEYTGFIDNNGREIIVLDHPRFVDLTRKGFREKKAVIGFEQRSKTMYGCIDPTGSMAIPFEFDTLNDFSEGLAIASKGKKIGFINTLGEFVIKPIYDSVLWNGFHQNTAKCMIGNTTVIINHHGNIIWPKMTKAIMTSVKQESRSIALSPVEYLDKKAYPKAKKLLWAHLTVESTMSSLLKECENDSPHEFWNKVKKSVFVTESGIIIRKLIKSLKSISKETKVLWIAVDDYPEGFTIFGASEWSGKASDWKWLEQADIDYGSIHSTRTSSYLGLASLTENSENYVSPYTVMEMLFTLVYFGSCAIEAAKSFDNESFNSIGLVIGHVDSEYGLILSNNISTSNSKRLKRKGTAR